MPRPQLPLLAAAVGQRHEPNVPPGDERPDPDGPTELVRRHGQQVGAARGEVDGQVPDRLHGVGVERDAVLVRDGGDARPRPGPCRPRCWPT